MSNVQVRDAIHSMARSFIHHTNGKKIVLNQAQYDRYEKLGCDMELFILSKPIKAR